MLNSDGIIFHRCTSSYFFLPRHPLPAHIRPPLYQISPTAPLLRSSPPQFRLDSKAFFSITPSSSLDHAERGMTKVPLQSSPAGSASYETEHVMNYRGGSVLGKKTILKSDHFPGCQNKRLTPQIDGAPNYRQAGSLPVHGVAIPTINGIRNVLIHIGAWQNGQHKKVLWHNLREEPGINRARVEQMESRLKEDILIEAVRYGSKILVTDELPDGQMVDLWEPVTRDCVKTPLEVYQELQIEGYLVDYERVPITDEKSPKERDFDDLVHRISQVESDTEYIFNCQMGRGRTTTGMVIATLVYLNRIGASGENIT